MEESSPWVDPVSQQNILRRNLERQLAASIQQYASVETATVHLSLPERQPLIPSMLNYTSEERLALLLSVLGDEVAQAAVGGVEPGRAAVLRKLLKDYQSDPPSHAEMEHLVGDFLRYFNFAMETLAPQLKTIHDKSKTKEPQSPPPRQEKPVFFPKVNRSHDPVADLNRLDPYQIAVALADEHPKTIALVLQKLATQGLHYHHHLHNLHRNVVPDFFIECL